MALNWKKGISAVLAVALCAAPLQGFPSPLGGGGVTRALAAPQDFGGGTVSVVTYTTKANYLAGTANQNVDSVSVAAYTDTQAANPAVNLAKLVTGTALTSANRDTSLTRASSYNGASAGLPEYALNGVRAADNTAASVSSSTSWATAGGSDHSVTVANAFVGGTQTGTGADAWYYGLGVNLGSAKTFDTVVLFGQSGTSAGFATSAVNEVSLEFGDATAFAALPTTQARAGGGTDYAAGRAAWPYPGGGPTDHLWRTAYKYVNAMNTVQVFKFSQPITEQYLRVNLKKAGATSIFINSIEVYNSQAPTISLDSGTAAYLRGSGGTAAATYTNLGAGVASVTADDNPTPLTLTTDYGLDEAVSGKSTVTLTNGFLEGLSVGSHTVKVKFDDGGETVVATWVIVVSSPAPKLDFGGTAFLVGSERSVSATFTNEGHTVSSVTVGSALSSPTDYTVSVDGGKTTVTLTNAYLRTLAASATAYTVGVEFSDGTVVNTWKVTVYAAPAANGDWGTLAKYAAISDYAAVGHSDADAAAQGVNLILRPAGSPYTWVADNAANTARASTINNATNYPYLPFRGNRTTAAWSNTNSWSTQSGNGHGNPGALDMGTAADIGEYRTFNTIVVYGGVTTSNAAFNSAAANQYESITVQYGTEEAFKKLPTAQNSGYTNWTAPDDVTSEWTTIAQTTIGINNTAKVYVFKLDSPVTARFVRLNLHKNAGNVSQPFINAFELYYDHDADYASAFPLSATYNKKAANAVTTTVTAHGTAAFTGITGLTQGTEYSVSGNTVTFAPAFLAGLADGDYTYTLNFSNSVPNSAVFKLKVETPADASLTPTGASYNKTLHTPATLDVVMNLPGGNALVNIKNGASTVAASNYTVSGATVTFKQAFLDTLGGGANTLTFNFAFGGPAVYTVMVNTPAGGVILPLKAAYDATAKPAVATTMTLNGCTLESISYSASMVDAGNYTVSGNTVTFSSSYLDGLGTGVKTFTLNLTNGGGTIDFPVTIGAKSGIDYSIWEMQTPTILTKGTLGRDKLVSRQYDWFWYPGVGVYDGYDMFQTPKTGQGTSSNTGNTRTELRELLPDSAGTQAWWHNGYHKMTFDVKVDHVDRLGNAGKTSIAQVWGLADASGATPSAMFELFYYWDGKLECRAPSLSTSASLYSGGLFTAQSGGDYKIAPGTAFTVTFEVSGGALQVYINEAIVTWRQNSSPNATVTSFTLDNGDYYFKAGNYDQSTTAGADNVAVSPDVNDAHSLVGFKAIDVWHNTIKGRLADGAGAGMASQSVAYTMTGGGLAAPVTKTVTTDADGYYVIPNVPNTTVRSDSSLKTVISNADGQVASVAITVPAAPANHHLSKADASGETALSGRTFTVSARAASAVTGVYEATAVKYEPDVITVTFDANGGALGDAATQGVAYGQYAAQPGSPTWANRVFSGWHTGAVVGGKLTLNASAWDFGVNAVTAPITLYAKWVDYTRLNELVTAAGGRQGEANYDERFTLTTRNALAAAKLAADNLAAAAAQAEVDAAAQALELALRGLATQYYTVTFETGAGTPIAPQSVEYGAAASEPTADPTRAGHTFGGWYKEVQYTNNFVFADPITADTIVYAKWDAATYGDDTALLNAAAAIIGDPESVAKYTAATFNALSDAFTAFSNAPGDGTNRDDLIAALANLALNVFTVGFDVDGGSAVTPQNVVYKGYAVKPEDPTLADKLFGGWYADAGFAAPFDFSAPITAVTTIYAKWLDAAAHTVTFKPNGGVFTDDGGTADRAQPSVAFNALLFEPIVAKAGHILTGWLDALGAAWDFAVNRVTADTTLTAQWAAVVTPVTGITLDKATATLDIGASVTLTAMVLPADATDKTVTWTTSGAAVATVLDGVVTAVGEGAAVITAQAGGFSAECAVTVNAPPVDAAPVDTPPRNTGRGESEDRPQNNTATTPQSTTTPQTTSRPQATAAPAQATVTDMPQAQAAAAERQLEQALERNDGVSAAGEPFLVSNVTKPTVITLPAQAADAPLTTVAMLMPDGTLTPVPTYTDPRTGQVSALVGTNGVYVAVSAEKSFTDVSPSDWFSNLIASAAGELLLQGDGNGRFRPNDAATVAEMTKMFENAIGLPSQPLKPGEKWYAGAMAAAISAGMADADVKPEDKGTRAEAALMAVAAFKAIGGNVSVTEADLARAREAFKDIADLPLEQQQAFALCLKLGVFSGYGDGTVRPRQTLTRAEMVTLALKLREAVVAQIVKK